MQLCGWAHYRATRKNLQSRTQMDEPNECASGGNPLLHLCKILHLLFFPLVRILCALRLESRKTNTNVVLMQDLWNFGFFGGGDVSPTHSELSLCFGVIGKKTRLISCDDFVKKNFVCIDHPIMSWQDVTRSSLCSGVEESGTKCAHNFLFPKSSFRIRRTTVLEMFKDSAIILDAIRWSILTKSATAAMFTSVQVNFGQPPLLPSSTSSLPS